jgi:hypothetical protein
MSHMAMRRFADDARNASFGRGRALLGLCAAAAAVFVVACGSDSSPTGPGGPTQTTPNGSYTISTINSAALPAAIFSDTGGFKLEVMSGSITLNSGGTYSIITNYRETLPGVSDLYTDSTGGTWAMTAGTSTVVFTNAADSTQDQATWKSGQLTFVEPGVSPPQITFVYKLKQ